MQSRHCLTLVWHNRGIRDVKKVATFAERLSKALKEKNMKPIRLAEQTGISKSAISQYLSGSFSPKHAYISIMADTLGVDEFWLMGYEESHSDPRLTLEDIRKINRLTKDDMAGFMGISLNDYIFYANHPDQLECTPAVKLSHSLNIGLQYLKTGL